MANSKVIGLLKKALELVFKKSASKDLNIGNVIQTVVTDPKAATKWNNLPASWKLKLIRSAGVETPAMVEQKIFANGNAADLAKWYKTAEGRHWVKLVNEKGPVKATTTVTSKALPKAVTLKAAEIASSIAAVYAVDEGIEKLQDIPGVGYVINQASIGPWLLSDYITGLLPGVGEVATGISHGIASFMSNVFDFIGLDGIANWLKEYNQVYENKKAAKAAESEAARQHAIENFATQFNSTFKDTGLVDGLKQALKTDGLKGMVRYIYETSKENESNMDEEEQPKESLAIWVSDLSKRA